MLICILAELKEEPPGDPGPGPRKAMFLEWPKSAEVWVHDERAQWCRVGSMLGHPSAWTMARGHRRPTSSYSQVSLLKGSFMRPSGVGVPSQTASGWRLVRAALDLTRRFLSRNSIRCAAAGCELRA